MAIPMFWILGLIFLVLRLFQIINLITEKLRINVNKPLWLRFSLINVTRKPNEYSWILLIFWISIYLEEVNITKIPDPIVNNFMKFANLSIL